MSVSRANSSLDPAIIERYGVLISVLGPANLDQVRRMLGRRRFVAAVTNQGEQKEVGLVTNDKEFQETLTSLALTRPRQAKQTALYSVSPLVLSKAATGEEDSLEDGEDVCLGTELLSALRDHDQRMNPEASVLPGVPLS